MKKFYLFLICCAAIMAGCSENNGGEGEGILIPPVQEQLSQKAYADNETTAAGFSFTTGAPWTASVKEVQVNGMAQASASAASTRAGEGEGNQVAWLKLYNGDTEAYRGSAGEVSLRIVLEQNYTGKRREATVTIRSGNNSFIVTVVQEGTKQDGSSNEAPVKVTKITLDRSELLLQVGAEAVLKATVEPDDATIKSVVWSSSDSRIATVHPVNGTVTAVATGKATITATSTSNKEVTATCAVTVEGDQPLPERKLLKKITLTTVGTVDDDGTVTSLLSYDSEKRLVSVTAQNYDGPGTEMNINYVYAAGMIESNGAYKHEDGTGTVNVVYKIATNGYALSSHTEELDDEPESDKYTYDSEYVYDDAWRLTKVTEEGDYVTSSVVPEGGGDPVKTKSRDRSVSTLTWKNNNVVAINTSEYTDRADAEPSYFYKNTVEYGSEKATLDIDLAVCIGSLYIPGAYDEIIPIYGQKSEYLPVKVESYYWSARETTPAVPNEIMTYAYQFENGYLMKAIVTTTVPNPAPWQTASYTETFEFEYE